MKPAVEIRQMSAGDLPAVLDIQAACYTALMLESRQSLHAKLRASPSTCLVASIGDETVGYLVALPWESSRPPALNTAECRLPASPDCLHLHDLAVTPAARKLGAGRVLVEAFLARLEASGLGSASLVAVQDSAPYWERFGFRAVPACGPLESTLSTYGQEVRYMERRSHSAPLEYRSAVPGDAAACVLLRGRTRENAVSAERLGSAGITAATWGDDIRSGTLPGFVCLSGGKLAGYCFGAARSGEIVVLALLPEFENQGIGANLLNRVVAVLKSHGRRRFFLGCSPDPRSRSYGFYRHLGWRSTGTFDKAGDEILELHV